MASVQVAFAGSENLWRKIRRQDAANGRVKPGSIRLQVSVVRSGKGVSSAEGVARELGTGVAEATVAAVRALEVVDATIACIDEPTREEPSHALISVLTVLEPSAIDEARLQADARKVIAEALRIVISPV